MYVFNNILFVGGMVAEADGLGQALKLAGRHGGSVHIQIVPGRLPASFGSHTPQYEAALQERWTAQVENLKSSLAAPERDVPVSLSVESGDLPVTRVIRRVLQFEHDMVIKEAEPLGRGTGFKSLDMELLRKCPCPVWLNRPAAGDDAVAVAIDPEAGEKAGAVLGLNLLQLASELAAARGAGLHVISCWDYEFEEYLRGSAWVSEADLVRDIANTQLRHRGALQALVRESGIKLKAKIHHVRGAPERMIPMLIEEHHAGLLVMGTVARTGIPGFIIGNTAENVFRGVTCSLVAAKPAGFITPVKLS